MQFSNFIIALLVSYLGLYCGIFLAKIAKEEIKPGRIYFVYLQNIILIIIFIVIFHALNLHPIINTLLAIFLAVFLFYFETEMFTYLIYIPLGILAAIIARLIMPYLGIMLLLIFIYGMPTGTLLAGKKKYFVPLLYTLSYIPAAILTYLLLP